ncbi:MAG: flagellar biosynthesis protein FlhB [Gammaproteobacteria bacterium]|nr:MAG: flagellar biosynthesis protein FlhB [Gammaproteobacteria bacterium]
MAENEDGQEQSEQPTEKRKRDSKEKGQVPRSKDLTTALLLMASVLALYLFGNYMAQGLIELFHYAFKINREVIFDDKSPVIYMQTSLIKGLLLVAPMAIMLFIVAIVAPALLGGWTFSAEALTPKLEKLSPLSGLKRMFGLNAVIELIKSIIKVVVVGLVSLWVFFFFKDDFLQLTNEPLKMAIGHSISIFFWAFFMFSASLLLIVAVDVPYQLYQHNKKLKMTKQEVKEEYKQTEGKPEVKGRIRQLQRQMANARMMQDVPDADVVVTNPTHYSIALKYDQLNMKAPLVVARGTDLVAAKIREIAIENEVPLYEAPPLARALYYTTDIGDEVPSGLYVAVAKVLAYIFQLKNMKQSEKEQFTKPEVDIPEEYQRYTEMGKRSDE